MLIVLDAGANVLSILVLTPTKEAFGAYETDVERMLSALIVKRAARAEPAVQPQTSTSYK